MAFERRANWLSKQQPLQRILPLKGSKTKSKSVKLWRKSSKLF